MVPRRVVLISYDTIYCAQVLPGVIEKHVEIEMRMVKKQMLEILVPALWACFFVYALWYFGAGKHYASRAWAITLEEARILWMNARRKTLTRKMFQILETNVRVNQFDIIANYNSSNVHAWKETKTASFKLDQAKTEAQTFRQRTHYC